MSDFGVTLTGDRKATLRFDRFPAFAHDRLLAAMQDIEVRLEAAVVAAEPRKTGRLRSLTGGRVYDHGSRIAAVVGVRAPNAREAIKAAALEFGSHDPEQVLAHRMYLDHWWSRAVPRYQVDVPTHGRTPNVAERRFLRDPLDAIRGDAVALMRKAIEDAAGDVAE